MDLNKWVGINPAPTPYNHRLKWKPINFQATPPATIDSPNDKSTGINKVPWEKITILFCHQFLFLF